MTHSAPQNTELSTGFEKKKSEVEVVSTPSSDDKSSAEIGGRGGLDPTRYGDWEKNGRCIDF
jgi:hypothetical protein